MPEDVAEEIIPESNTCQDKIDNTDFNLLKTTSISIHFLKSIQLQQEGENIKVQLIECGISADKITVKGFPQSWFDSNGGLSSNQIRYERNTEEQVAEELKSLLEVAYPKRSFNLQTIKGRTPNSISIFLK